MAAAPVRPAFAAVFRRSTLTSSREDVIQSVEILKTGASSVYGSDAIAGVVNLITKKDLRGLQVRGFGNLPTHGGGEDYSISGIYGAGLGTAATS